VKRPLVLILNFLLLSVPATMLCAAEEKAIKLEQKVDLAKLSGINHFFAYWYNENLWLYATIVTVLMGVVGLLIAVVTDLLLKMIGMEVSKIEHHE
jgi:ABC-type phosphate/phosphonate transport system permease subunit